MKRFLVLLVAAFLLPAAALADFDLSAMSVEELTQLRDAASLELAGRAGTAAQWDTPSAHVELTDFRRGVGNDGEPVLEVMLKYTNMNTEIDNFRASHWVTLYQDGVEQERSIYIDGELVDVDSWGRKAQPGATLLMQWVFALSGSSKTVDVEVEYRQSFKAESAGIVTIALSE